jgi:hypothetical protein
VPMKRLAGGCQCGAVRYALAQPPEHVSICHCRMCQKASGQPFMALARVAASHFAWTRGQVAVFRSSNIVERGFCPACGTPLSYRVIESPNISVTVGSLDDPESAPPELQYGMEGRLSWTAGLAALPGIDTDEWLRQKGLPSVTSHQHPDREDA